MSDSRDRPSNESPDARREGSGEGEGAWRVHRARVAHATPYFRVIRSDVERPDGAPADYHTLDFPRPAVSIIPRGSDGRILLVRQHRFIVDRAVWALPSGGVEPGERAEEAAARELVEETGCEAERLVHLVSYYPSYGVSNQVFHCFVAEGARPVAGRRHDPNEVARVAWFTDEEVRRLAREGGMPDGLSLTPLAWLWAGLAPQPVEEIARCRRVPLVE